MKCCFCFFECDILRDFACHGLDVRCGKNVSVTLLRSTCVFSGKTPHESVKNFSPIFEMCLQGYFFTWAHGGHGKAARFRMLESCRTLNCHYLQ